MKFETNSIAVLVGVYSYAKVIQLYTLNMYILLNIFYQYVCVLCTCVRAGVCMPYACVEIKRQVSRVGSLLPLWFPSSDSGSLACTTRTFTT